MKSPLSALTTHHSPQRNGEDSEPLPPPAPIDNLPGAKPVLVLPVRQPAPGKEAPLPHGDFRGVGLCTVT